MPMFNLPWRPRSFSSASEEDVASEAQASGATHPPDKDAGWIDLLSAADDQAKREPILGLIGSTVEESAFDAGGPGEQPDSYSATTTSTTPTVARDLIDSLHRQYWRALADPHDVLMGSWAWQANEPMPAPMIEAAESGWQAPQASFEYESIEALLSGKHTLEDAFGKMTPGHEEFEIDAVPEVLRLFASVEYHAAEARRPPALPPALNRREHHTLSVDSAFVAPAHIDQKGSEELA